MLSVVAYGRPKLDAEDCLDCVFPLHLLIAVLAVDAADGHLLLERLPIPLDAPDDNVRSLKLCLVYLGTNGRSNKNILY